MSLENRLELAEELSKNAAFEARIVEPEFHYLNFLFQLQQMANEKGNTSLDFTIRHVYDFATKAGANITRGNAGDYLKKLYAQNILSLYDQSKEKRTAKRSDNTKYIYSLVEHVDRPNVEDYMVFDPVDVVARQARMLGMEYTRDQIMQDVPSEIVSRMQHGFRTAKTLRGVPFQYQYGYVTPGMLVAIDEGKKTVGAGKYCITKIEILSDNPLFSKGVNYEEKYYRKDLKTARFLLMDKVGRESKLEDKNLTLVVHLPYIPRV